MAKAAVANRRQIALLMWFMVLVGIPRIRLRDVFNEERCALNGAVAFEKVELVVGDSLEKRGRAGWDGAGSKFIGNSAKDFVHGSDGHRVKIASSKFGAADVPPTKFGSLSAVIKLTQLAASCAVSMRHGDMLKPNRLLRTFDAANWKVSMGNTKSAVINLTDFEGFHGSACGKFLSDEELNLFHVLGNLALGFAAICPVATGKAVLVFGLSHGEQFFCCCQLLLDGIEEFCGCHFQVVMGW